MIFGKEWIAWIAFAVFSLIGVWWACDRAYARGAHSRDLEVSNLNTQVAQAAVALSQCDAAGKRNKLAADAQRAMANAALESATQRDKNRTKELTDAVNKLRAAQATADCKKVAEMELCPAMSAY